MREPIDWIAFAADTLSAEEKTTTSGWFKTLAQRNVSTGFTDDLAAQLTTLITYQEFIAGGCLNNCNDWATLYAIGSSVKNLPNENTAGYNDLDFLLVTNRIWRDVDHLDRLTESQLKKSYDLTFDQKPSGAYAGPQNRPNRVVLKMSPVDKETIPIDLTIQPEISSESVWDQLDKKQKIPICRINDTAGYSPF